MNYLDFEKQEKGYAKFNVWNKELVRANIGKQICYVDYVEPYRGTYFVRYGTIQKLHRNQIWLEKDGSRVVDIRDIKECGIKID